MKITREDSSPHSELKGESAFSQFQRTCDLVEEIGRTPVPDLSLSLKNLNVLLVEQEKQQNVLKDDIPHSDTPLLSASNSNSKRVFISHSSQNAEIATHFQSLLIKLGVNREHVFCSSIPDQGVRDGENINNYIYKELNEASQIVFLLSQDFVSSPYCMQELGIGWFLSQRTNIKCYYLILSDIEDSEIHGFVNSKTMKTTHLSEQYSNELSPINERICENYGIAFLKHSAASVEENIFWSSTRQLFLNLNDKHKANLEQARKYEAMATLNAKLQRELEEERKAASTHPKSVELKTEYQSITDSFRWLGLSNGLTKQQYDTFDKEFWFKVIQRYLDLQKVLNYQASNYAMEKLIATIFSFEQKYPEAYQHFKNYISLSIEAKISIFYFHIESFISAYPKSVSGIITLLKSCLPNLREGHVKDSYVETIKTLSEREKKIKADRK